MSKSKISHVLISMIFGAFLISGSSFAGTSSAKRTPASGTCSGAAKQYAAWAAASTGTPTCARRAAYLAKGYTPLQVVDNCAADFATQTTTDAPENKVFTVTVAGAPFMVSCTYTTGGDAAEGDNGCHCSTAAAN
jgi:hypothetical protein